jgi:outer membrane immunogenic protein
MREQVFRTGLSVLTRWCPGFCLVVAAAASAVGADLSTAPAYKAPPPTAPYFDWSGFYGGANVGGGWTSDSLHQTANGTGLNATTNSSGVVGGGRDAELAAWR